jgi:hypothetical protein
MSLPAIVALARAGASDAAWKAFNDSGHHLLTDSPAAKTVEGRLLKDKAASAGAKDRAQLYGKAAAAYARAAELEATSYALINAATLSDLAGRPDDARDFACRVLQIIEGNPHEPETPYYRYATRAEALLLLEREEESRRALAQAVAVAPSAWEDHASTVRQLALILNRQERSAQWLDAFRPPCPLHFAGHMSFRPDEPRAELRRRIDAKLEEERIGFGYGALAAGADIIVAEALLTRGAELHAVLPAGIEPFAALSVDPFGPEWRRRFDAAVERASSVRIVRPFTIPDATMIALADEVAMGAALTNARRLESSAVQLLVLADGASGRARDVWAEAGRRQHILDAPREDVTAEPQAAPAPGWRRLAVVSAYPEGGSNGLAVVRDAFDDLPTPAVAPYLEGGAVTVAYATPLAAAQAAVALREAVPGLRIGGHYGVAETFQDPFSGGERIAGDAAAAAAGALSSALPGTAYITEDFAAALIASSADAPRTEFIGELDPPDDGPPVGLFVLKS